MRKLEIRIPVDVLSPTWAQRFTDSLIDNLEATWKKEDGKLRREMSNYGKGVYESVIKQYYSSYTPEVYDRHGYLPGFNLYLANNVEFVGRHFKIKPKAENLWPYYTFSQSMSIRGMTENEKADPNTYVKTTVDSEKVLDFILSGHRSWPYNKDGMPFSAQVSIPNIMPKQTGSPNSIFKSSEKALEEFYNKEIIRRIAKTFRSIKRIWVR